MSSMNTNTSSAWTALLERVAAGLPVRTDSRLVEPGDVFVAVTGAAQDGVQFVPMALEKGAGFVVAASDANFPAASKAQLVLHPDPRWALGQLAGALNGTATLPFPLVGITGTNGKTTIAYLVEHVMAAAGGKPGVLSTVEYRWPGESVGANLTTPGCLAIHSMLGRMIRAGVTGAVMEASSHALDQGRVEGLTFDAAVLTNVTQDHLDYHKDMETYFAAKRRLFEAFLKSSSSAVLNGDDHYGRRLLTAMPDALGYGLGKKGDTKRWLQGEILSASTQGMELQMHYQGTTWKFFTPLAGAHNAANLLAAQGACLTIGFSPDQLLSLATCHGAPGRLERVANKQGLHIFVDYAHTPDALENVLSALRKLDFGKIVTVFGCGGNRDRAKRPLMAQAVAKWTDVAVLTSDNPRHEDPQAIMDDAMPGLAGAKEVIAHPDRRKAIAMALERLTPADVLLIAGKGHETYQQIGDVKYPFNDVDVVKELLA
jgi:UDP-N-acetylmuramoyl-L-alanyl-D-glutamate--2,6-diaminopimelate ligase